MSTTKKKTALGRGFESLLPTELFDEAFDPTSEQDAKVSDLRQLPLDQIEADKEQPRKAFEEEAMQALAQSIKQHGVLQPIVVIKKGDKYKIVAGERRYRASKLVGLKKIPAIIRTLSAQNRLELSLIENVQRQDLNVIEIATGYLKLREQFNLTLKQISERVSGKTVGAISNTMRLLRLPQEAIEALSRGELSEGQAKPLIGMDHKIVLKLLPQIIKQNWSARRVERVTANYKNIDQDSNCNNKKVTKIVQEEQAIQAITQRLDAKVKIKSRENGSGTIQINFRSRDDLERIIKFLS
ncbi:MAG: ParB/RepB/Spo0J family partition protein [Candidatus Saccharibacteria bacterium]|nr:ParB/RepB/Spo0J family partition protein [Candidatus Saccharibacteria bacterium]